MQSLSGSAFMRSSSGCAHSRGAFLNHGHPSSIVQAAAYAPRPPLQHRSSSSVCTHARHKRATATSSSAQTLYDREHNRKLLSMLGQRAPRAITVIVGPRSSGKTALLQDFVQHQGPGQSLAYVDCRSIDAGNPTAFARALLSLGLPAIITNLPAKWKEQALNRLGQVLAGMAAAVKMTEKGMLAAVGLTQQELTISLADTMKAYAKAAGKEVMPSTHMSTVFDLYSELLNTWAEARAAGQLKGPAHWPVLVVDEANMLMSWQDTHPKELQQLLNFFVARTKQQNAAHVLLCTSEYGFMSWLNQAVGESFWRPAVIGDFKEVDARGFLEEHLGVGRMSDGDWAKVYEVCGGNAGYLGLVADEFADPGSSGDWDAVLQSIWELSLPRVKAAAQGGQGWTAAQYADAALLLLRSECHAVPVKQMQAQFGRHITSDEEQQLQAGEEALAALVRANALSLRPYSPWAEDISAHAFGMPRSAVVTAPSHVHLHCMRNIKDRLERTLQRWEEQKQDMQQERAVGAEQRPGSPSSPEVQQVRQEIKEVGQEIKEVMAEIRAAVAAGNKDMEAWLVKREQQLRQKEVALLGLLPKAGESA